MKKINIMYLYSSKGFGGMVRNISLLVNNLDSDISKVVVALTNEGDEDSEIYLKEGSGVIFCRINENHRLDFDSLKAIKELTDKYKIDILSCHGYKADFYGFMLRKFYKYNGKLITMAHGWVTPGLKNEMYYIIDKIVIRYFDKIVLVGEGLRKELKGFMIPALNLAVIDNAIDLSGYEERGDRSALRRQFGLNENDFVVGFVGRLSKEKSIETILNAMRKASSLLNEIKLLVAGDGPERRRLENMAQKMGLNDRVIFAGYRKDIKDIFNMLDLYVSAAVKEGLPNSILEAQAAGIPCIATDIPGNNDIIKDGQNGFLIEVKDYYAMFERIIALLVNENLRKKFTEEGKKVIGDRFSLKNRVEKIKNLYYDILQ